MNLFDFIEKVKEFEGLRLKAYRCPSGVLTIGYGHTHGVTSSMVISEYDSDFFLSYDIAVIALQLKSLHPYIGNAPTGVLFALIDFVFNVGYTKYKNSSLCKKYISKGIYDVNAISIELLKWTRSNGKVLKGLEKRRAWEVSLLTENFK